jgi:hypothetical protein
MRRPGGAPKFFLQKSLNDDFEEKPKRATNSLIVALLVQSA